MQDSVLANARRRIVRHPSHPRRVGESRIVCGCAVSPLRVRGAAGSVACFHLGVVYALAAPACNPNIRCHPILVGGLGRVGAVRFGEDGDRAVPDGGRAAAQRPGQCGKAKAHEYVIGVSFHFGYSILFCIDPDIRCVTLPASDSGSPNSPDAVLFNMTRYPRVSPPRAMPPAMSINKTDRMRSVQFMVLSPRFVSTNRHLPFLHW